MLSLSFSPNQTEAYYRKTRTGETNSLEVSSRPSKADTKPVINGSGNTIILDVQSGILKEPSMDSALQAHYTQEEFDAIYDEIYVQAMEHDDYLD